MKKLILIAILILTGVSFQAKAQDYYNRGYDNSYNNGYDNDGFGYFYSNLSPYGSWIEFGDGVYGWKPYHITSIWAPYSDGQWVWTSDGWYWDSYEPFGYIVYHYGRWYYDGYYGWIWIPEYQWAPAWVEWRYDNDYIGWAPLPPYAVFSISAGIHFTKDFYTPYSHWHFVKYNYFNDPYVGKYFVAEKYKYRIYSNTKYRHDYGYRNGRVVDNGVDVNLVRQRGKVEIPERKIRTVQDLRDMNNGNRVTNNEVRAFIPGKDNFSGAKVKDVKIEKTNRNTSLEASKLEFGRTNVQRNETPVNNTGKTGNVQTDRNSNGSVNQNKTTGQKRAVPNTGTNNTERKQVKVPVQKTPQKKDTRIVTPEKKDTRVVTPGRTETRQVPDIKKNETKKNETVNNNSRTQIKTNTPPVQQRTEVKGNTGSRESGNVRNSGNQMQGSKGNDRAGRK